MLKLLKIEWMKLRYYRTFWILTSLYLASIVGINFIVYKIEQRIFEEKQSKGIAEMIIGQRRYSFPTVWQMTSYVSSFLLTPKTVCSHACPFHILCALRKFSDPAAYF